MFHARMKRLTLFTILLLTLSAIAHSVSAQEPPLQPPNDPDRRRTVGPAAPTLSGTASTGQTNLSWTTASGAVKYELRAWTISDEWIYVDTNITATSYNHADLTADLYYYYWVRGINSAGVSGAWSNTVDLYVPPNPAATDTPAPTATSTPEPTATNTPAPTFLAAPVVSLNASVGQVVVSWNAVPNADTYDAYWYTVEHGKWVRFAENETGTSVTHTGVVSGRRYHYTVIAENDSGLESDWSDYVDVVIPVPTATPVPPTSTPQPGVTPTSVPVPGKVGGISSTTNYVNRTITLYWKNPNPSAHRYEVVYWDGEWVDLAGDNHTSTSLVHSNIDSDRSYLYHVRGINSTGTAGSWSDRWTVTVGAIVAPTPAVPPAQPENFDAIAGCNDYALSCRPFLWPWSEIWLSWFHSQHAHGNEKTDPITYEVVVSKMYPGNPQPVYHTTLTSEYQYVRHTGLVSGDTYVYELKAKNRFSELYSAAASSRPTVNIGSAPSIVFPKRPWHHQRTIGFFTQGSDELLRHQANCTPRIKRESCKTESLPGSTSAGKSVEPTPTPTP